jgi:predicted DNA-binding protein
MERSKMLAIRLPEDLHCKLKVVAMMNGLTLQDVVCGLIEAYLEVEIEKGGVI